MAWSLFCKCNNNRAVDWGVDNHNFELLFCVVQLWSRKPFIIWFVCMVTIFASFVNVKLWGQLTMGVSVWGLCQVDFAAGYLGLGEYSSVVQLSYNCHSQNNKNFIRELPKNLWFLLVLPWKPQVLWVLEIVPGKGEAIPWH